MAINYLPSRRLLIMRTLLALSALTLAAASAQAAARGFDPLAMWKDMSLCIDSQQAKVVSVKQTKKDQLAVSYKLVKGGKTGVSDVPAATDPAAFPKGSAFCAADRAD